MDPHPLEVLANANSLRRTTLFEAIAPSPQSLCVETLDHLTHGSFSQHFLLTEFLRCCATLNIYPPPQPAARPDVAGLRLLNRRSRGGVRMHPRGAPPLALA